MPILPTSGQPVPFQYPEWIPPDALGPSRSPAPFGGFDPTILLRIIQRAAGQMRATRPPVLNKKLAVTVPPYRQPEWSLPSPAFMLALGGGGGREGGGDGGGLVQDPGGGFTWRAGGGDTDTNPGGFGQPGVDPLGPPGPSGLEPEMSPPDEAAAQAAADIEGRSGANTAAASGPGSDPGANADSRGDPGPGWAHGGIVTRPMRGQVGEAGPEAVIPLRDVGDLIRSLISLSDEPGAKLYPAKVRGRR